MVSEHADSWELQCAEHYNKLCLLIPNDNNCQISCDTRGFIDIKDNSAIETTIYTVIITHEIPIADEVSEDPEKEDNEQDGFEALLG